METIEKIKQYLKENKITYEELSQMSGIPKNSLNQIFRGRVKNPRLDTMTAIYNALGLSDAALEDKPEILELYEQLRTDNQELAKAYIFGLLASENKAYFDTIQQKMVLRTTN